MSPQAQPPVPSPWERERVYGGVVPVPYGGAR